MESDNVRPDKEIVLEESGKTLKMTYTMMNDILRYVGPAETAIISILSDQTVRDFIVRRLFTDSKKEINEVKDLIPSSEVELDVFELDDLMLWVTDHVTYFFMRMNLGVEKSMGRYPEMQKKMIPSDPSETGSTPSQESIKSAGPTE